MYRSPSLENKEIMALYGQDGDPFFIKDEDCISEEYDLDSECSEEGKGGRGMRSSVSLEIYGLQREQQVYFSNQEYYRRLEELKSAHLRNMAELERMYISQGKEWRREGGDGGLGGWRNNEDRQSFSGPARRLQRINSQEELDFHDTSSGSDQSDDSRGDLSWTPNQEQSFEREILLSPEHMMTQRQIRSQPKTTCSKPQGKHSSQTGARIQSNSKVTVPKPFQMMLREEERKKHKVRTRSEIELENMLLKRELEELRECQKKFRASPAPAHIHLPLYEIISRRTSVRSNRSRSSCDIKNIKAAAPPQPFHFLEREKRKREAKIVAELGNFGHKVERQTFKARPMPSSVYGTRHRGDHKTKSRKPQTICTQEREATEGHSDPSSDLELEANPCNADMSPDSYWSQRCPSSKSMKKHIELSIEMVQDHDWSYVDPLKATTSAPRWPRESTQ